LIFAMVPSPEPESKSPLGKRARQLTPYWKSLLAGPILLYSRRSRLISIISPVRVPMKATESVG